MSTKRTTPMMEYGSQVSVSFYQKAADDDGDEDMVDQVEAGAAD